MGRVGPSSHTRFGGGGGGDVCHSHEILVLSTLKRKRMHLENNHTHTQKQKTMSINDASKSTFVTLYIYMEKMCNSNKSNLLSRLTFKTTWDEKKKEVLSSDSL